MNLETALYSYVLDNPFEMSCFIYLDSKKQRKRLGQNGVRSIPIHIPISYLKNMLD